MYLTIGKSDIPCVGRYDQELCDGAALTKTGDDGLESLGFACVFQVLFPLSDSFSRSSLLPRRVSKFIPCFDQDKCRCEIKTHEKEKEKSRSLV